MRRDQGTSKDLILCTSLFWFTTSMIFASLWDGYVVGLPGVPGNILEILAVGPLALGCVVYPCRIIFNARRRFIRAILAIACFVLWVFALDLAVVPERDVFHVLPIGELSAYLVILCLIVRKAFTKPPPTPQPPSKEPPPRPPSEPRRDGLPIGPRRPAPLVAHARPAVAA